MDLTTIATALGLPVRKLQYVCSHNVLPGAARKGEGFGVRRSFTPFEAFGVALAAVLLDVGLSRRLVAATLSRTCQPPLGAERIADVPLYRAFASLAATLELGDGRRFRLRCGGRPGVAKPFDSGWVNLADGSLVSGDDPLVVTAIDLAALCRRLLENTTKVRGRSDSTSPESHSA